MRTVIVVVVIIALLAATAGAFLPGAAMRFAPTGSSLARPVPTDREELARAGDAATPAMWPHSGWVRSGAAVLTGTATGAVAAWLLVTTALGDRSEATSASVLLVVLVYAAFVPVSLLLAVVDVRVHRLPDAIVLPCYPVAAVGLTAACLLGAPWLQLLRAGLGMAVLYGFYLLLRVVGGRGMGGGDVKLAGVLGMLLGWQGWGALAVGLAAAFILGGLFSLALLVTGRAGRATAIPFGPWMLAGAWLGILTAGALSPALTGLPA